MKIIQSYWSLPSQQSSSIIDGRDSGGWIHKKYHYLSMALSCLLLRRYYDEVELITDTDGKYLLIDVLKLPYTSVSTDLDKFCNYPSSLWAIPKLYAYSIQDTPFLHVDGDVFIWEAFKPIVTQTAIVVQSPEIEHAAAYKEALAYLCNIIGYIPNFFDSCSVNDFRSVNAGVLGGTNFGFLSTYGKTALGIINANLSSLKSDCKNGAVNLVLEQLLLYNMCENNKIDISYIIPVLSSDYKEVLNFHRIPVLETFIHLIGCAKKSLFACEQVEFRLQYEFPEYYHYIEEFISAEWPVVNCMPERVTQNESYFARTKYLLQQIGIESYKNKELSFSIDLVRFIINFIGNKHDLLYIRDVFRLDRARVATTAHNSSFSLPMHRKSVYKLLGKRSRHFLLNCPITLIPSLCIIETKWDLRSLNELKFNILGFNEESSYILVNKDVNVFIEEQLFGWDKLLIYFYGNTINGYQLLSELDKLEYSSISNMEDGIVDFILIELTYTKRLTIKQ